jgi:MFS transporter, OFA family, oxalate/formate antiporter
MGFGRSVLAKEKIIKNRGWQVALAGTGINLALGVLYAWSIFKGAIAESIAQGADGAFSWDPASINDPYAVACLAFAFSMIAAGKCQDKFGPRTTAILGGLLVGSGFIIVSQTTSYWLWIFGFGILAGAGMGFGYSAATPPALKWFPPARTGLIAGVVVSGFGLAPVYIAPLAKFLLGTVGLQTTLLGFGIALTLVVVALGLLVVDPPEGYVTDPAEAARAAFRGKPRAEVSPCQLFTDSRFYTLWIIYFIGAGAGLMVIGSLAGLAKQSLGSLAFLAVAIMAIGNASGRLFAGVISDRFGRANTLLVMLVFQAMLMMIAIPVMGGGSDNAVVLTLLATFIGFNYGTNLSLFPAFAKDFWGLKNFGTNYGILFTAWGVGAFVLVRVAETLKAQSGSFSFSFAVAAILLLVAANLSLALRSQRGVVPAASPAAAVGEAELVPQKAD